ncbi:MAG: ImmA/IrrE family metallo-endopeptidase [Syntrophaceae bacterium]
MIPQAEASSFLDELGIEELPIVPVEICRTLGIHYSEDHLTGLDGLLILHPFTGHSIICVSNRITEQGRKHFTIAHELGHYCIDGLRKTEFYCSSEVVESFKSTIDSMELRANEFAAELLMPQKIYQPLVKKLEPGWDAIKELSYKSQTSLTATAIRFIDLSDYACCLIVSRARKILWFHKSEEFRSYVQMDSRLVSKDTVAFNIYQGFTPADNFEDVKACKWLSGKGVYPHTEILEWSLPLNSYGHVLTLLYDEEGIAGWDEEDYDNEDDEVDWEPPTFHKSKRKA